MSVNLTRSSMNCCRPSVNPASNRAAVNLAPSTVKYGGHSYSSGPDRSSVLNPQVPFITT